MVASKLNHSIVYHEKRSVENIDIGKLVSLYELEVENRLITKQSLVVSIGSPNKKYLEHGIIFFPIYLITNKKKAIQIGVFEILSKELYQVIDKTKEADIYEIENYDLLDSPLIWNWVDNLFLKKQKLSPLVLGEEEEEKKQSQLYIEEEEVNQLFEESREKAEELRRENDKNWVSQFMKNDQYDIEDSPDTSDSLFTTIKNAFSKINIILHENKIREKYANSKFVEKDFFYKKRIYDENKTRLVDLMNTEKDLKKEKLRIEE